MKGDNQKLPVKVETLSENKLELQAKIPQDSVQIFPSSNNVSPQKAGFIVRGAAYILDFFLLLVPLIFIKILFPDIDEDDLNNLLGLFLLIYFTLSTYFYGTTLGKKFFYLKVESIDARKISFARAFVREFLGKILSSLIFSLGFFWIIWDKEKQGWHDKLAKTYVISTQALSKGKRILAYFLVFFLPTLAFLGTLAVFILVAVNPTKQLEEARRQVEKEKQMQEQRRQKFIYPTSFPIN